MKCTVDRHISAQSSSVRMWFALAREPPIFKQ